MGIENSFVIGHISDLHFSEGTDQSNPNHSHSIDLLKSLQKKMSSIGDLDLLIVTGDITNFGDRQSLIIANGYLFKTIPIGKEEYIGLKLPPEKIGIIPGNHDAWNVSKTGVLADRRQKSLVNYNSEFMRHNIKHNDGCYYRWLEKNGIGIYIAFVDSCFLGDTEKNEESPFGTLRCDAVAKGKLSAKQAEKLLEWYDQGKMGRLEVPEKQNEYIDKEKFTKSLKILATHHYLFEPSGHKSDYFMRYKHRKIVFRNIAFADFDLLLCGHKHIPSFEVTTYGRHFDKRARNRYLINYFRRLIGLHSLPIQLSDGLGRELTRKLSSLVNIVSKLVKISKPELKGRAFANQVLEFLKHGLDDKINLKEEIINFLSDDRAYFLETFENGEMKLIGKTVSVGLNKNEKEKLAEFAKNIIKISKKLRVRPFLQVMCGSSAKSYSSDEKERGFNIYKISNNCEGWTILAEQYPWDHDSLEFLDVPFEQMHHIGKKL